MRLSDFVCIEAVVPQLESSDRDEVILELARSLGKSGKLSDGQVEDIAAAVVKREQEASTGIGKGVAVAVRGDENQPQAIYRTRLHIHGNAVTCSHQNIHTADRFDLKFVCG